MASSDWTTLMPQRPIEQSRGMRESVVTSGALTSEPKRRAQPKETWPSGPAATSKGGWRCEGNSGGDSREVRPCRKPRLRFGEGRNRESHSATRAPA